MIGRMIGRMIHRTNFAQLLRAAMVGAVLIAASFLTAPLAAADPPSPPADIRESPADLLDRLLRARRFDEAQRLMQRRMDDGDRDPVLLYNSACALAQLGQLQAAEKRLLECVKAGFRDFDAMEADDDLEPVRASRTYEAIMEARTAIDARAPSALAPRPRRKTLVPDPVAQWKSDHPEEYRSDKGYRYDHGEEGNGGENLVYATFLDEASHARMKRMLDELATHLRRAYFGKPPEDIVLVAIVRPADAKKYLERAEVRGMYLHSARRLVSRDAGQSLQHEFVHLLHFAQMERTGQRHPIWVQEGLASLYEDYEFRADGSVEFHPNIRFNIARRQVVSKTAKHWDQLFALSGEAFMQDAERLYPEVRSIFEFFAREKKLEEFYRQLCNTATTDPDGSSAVEKAFGEPLARVEDRWRKWMIERGAIDDSIDQNDASLGITVDDAGDGVRIRSFVLKSAAKAAGLRVGDVIFEVGGSPVRNRDEMQLAVARLVISTPVEVKFRRDEQELTLPVSPRALGR